MLEFTPPGITAHERANSASLVIGVAGSSGSYRSSRSVIVGASVDQLAAYRSAYQRAK